MQYPQEHLKTMVYAEFGGQILSIIRFCLTKHNRDHKIWGRRRQRKRRWKSEFAFFQPL